MSDQTISMWHWDETRSESGDSALDAKCAEALPDPEMLLVFAGPGGLPYLLRAFVTRQLALLRRVATRLTQRRLVR